MTRRRRTLRLIGALELISIANLFTGNRPDVAQTCGPVHGFLYPAGIALTWTSTQDGRIRALAMVPGVGSLLASTAWTQ